MQNFSNPMQKIKIYKKCKECKKDCEHIFYLKMFEDDEGFWIANGPYPKEQAEECLKESAKVLNNGIN